MHTYILGAGPAGLLIATQIIDAGQPATLVQRNKPATGRIRLIKKNLSGTESTYSLAVAGIKEIKPLPHTNFIICTKAVDAFSAFEQIMPQLNHESGVLFMNNGMGPQQQATAIRPDNVFWGTNTQGSYLDKGGNLIHAGNGQLLAGHPESRPLLSNFPEIIQKVPDIKTALWRKLAINALINPLTVKYQCRNGELLTNKAAIYEMEKLAGEIELLAQKLAIPLNSPVELATDIARSTADNWSSSMQDFFAGRPNELPFINGYIIRESISLGLAASYHQQLLDEIS